MTEFIMENAQRTMEVLNIPHADVLLELIIPLMDCQNKKCSVNAMNEGLTHHIHDNEFVHVHDI